MPNQNNTNKNQAELIQAISTLSEIDRMYYLKLKEVGFTADQALTLTCTLTKALLDPGTTTRPSLSFAWPRGEFKQ